MRLQIFFQFLVCIREAVSFVLPLPVAPHPRLCLPASLSLYMLDCAFKPLCQFFLVSICQPPVLLCKNCCLGVRLDCAFRGKKRMNVGFMSPPFSLSLSLRLDCAFGPLSLFLRICRPSVLLFTKQMIASFHPLPPSRLQG